ncbi:MAG TPA: YdcF family protein [Stellaceae bacterium]|jgi:uncharacterized SAM-binding protein YcdF (DUF218 family)|nr:YdcF family protein [Stellaceae bacterium]
MTADAIVVLGCRLKADGSPTLALRRRVALGVEMHRRGVASLLVLTGGNPHGGVTEAEAMFAAARIAGVPEAALLCEPRARNTAENALYSAGMLRKLGLERIALVSHRAHLFRAGLLFRLAGLKVVQRGGVPAQSASRAFMLALYELAALPLSVVRILRPRP